MSGNGLRHFLDLIDIPKPELRGMIDQQPRHEGASASAASASDAARRQDAGDDLRQALDPHARVVRRRHAPARRRGDHADRRRRCSSAAARRIADTARVLSRYVDAIMIRILDHDDGRRAGAPRHRAGDQRPDRRSHPCQVMADVMTFEEHRGPIRGRTVAWTGDANNVLASWMHAAERFDFQLRVATPPELKPKK